MALKLGRTRVPEASAAAGHGPDLRTWRPPNNFFSTTPTSVVVQRSAEKPASGWETVPSGGNSCIPSTNLMHPSQGVKHSRKMDASTVAAGATVKQSDGDDAQSLAFYLERGYSTFSSERLATSSIKNFRHYAVAGKFLVHTDHKPLIYAFQPHSLKSFF